WPLKLESLQAAHQLVKEQLNQGHLQLSTSPWNTPIFIIKKKSGKYRLLHDLRAVNDQMQAMDALQPGLPCASMLPENWNLLVIDLKDCFFTIRLASQDMCRFAFTLPSVNRESPAQRFEWTVLPQGMKNSPTLCQLFVADALDPVRKTWPSTLIYHYMDDILCCQQHPFTAATIKFLQQTLAQKGLQVASEKIQQTTPIKYLGWTITAQQVAPQKLQIHTDLKTLHDVQRFMGDIQWLRPVTGISNDMLEPLKPLL
ncbi:hypothetical protein N307_03486, partial [Dryobates pubescens]